MGTSSVQSSVRELNHFGFDGVPKVGKRYPSKMPGMAAQLSVDVAGRGFSVRFYVDENSASHQRAVAAEKAESLVRVSGRIGAEGKLVLSEFSDPA